MAEFRGGDVNAVLKLVKSLTAPEDGDAQLSILATALVIGCRSCGVPKERAMRIIADNFEQDINLVPLEQTSCT